MTRETGKARLRILPVEQVHVLARLNDPGTSKRRRLEARSQIGRHPVNQCRLLAQPFESRPDNSRRRSQILRHGIEWYFVLGKRSSKRRRISRTQDEAQHVHARWRQLCPKRFAEVQSERLGRRVNTQA